MISVRSVNYSVFREIFEICVRIVFVCIVCICECNYGLFNVSFFYLIYYSLLLVLQC